MRQLGAAVAAVLLVACRADVADGRFSCGSDSECPDGWVCTGGRCFSSAAAAGDAGVGDGGMTDGGIALGTSDASTPCGAQGLPCCAAPEPACGDQLFCELGSTTCRACGAMGQACCPPESTCRGADATCVDDTCVHCGDLDEPCCGGEACSSGTCCPPGSDFGICSSGTCP